MKTFLIILSLISIVWWIVAKLVNKYTYEGQHGEVRLPDSLAFVIIGAIVFVVALFLAVIPAQECGVVVTPHGVKERSYPTGWHVVLPWYEVERMDKTIQVYTCADPGSGEKVSEDDFRMTEAKKNSIQGTVIWAPTVDGIKMGFSISASWKIDPEYAWWIYDNVSEQDGVTNGRFYWLEENVIKAKLKSALSLTASKYTPIEVYSNKREEIQALTKEVMKREIQPYHLILEQIDIREVYYNPEYEQSINQKKLEEQKALTLIEITKQKNELLKQAEIDKNIEITKAEAEAKALQIKGQSISNNPRVVELEWINKWNGELPTYMLGSGQNIMLGLNK